MSATSRILRPDAVALPGGRIEAGLEVCMQEGRISEIRPWTTAAREEVGMLLSPAFVNSHSHLEYRGFQGELDGLEYWPWIRELTRRKPLQSEEDVRQAALLAARENAKAGVAAIGEVSDFPVSGAAMRAAGLGGRIYQEVITFREWCSPEEKVAKARLAAEINARESGLSAHLSVHAPYTVAREVLQEIANVRDYNCIHVSETEHENEFYQFGSGPIAEMYMSAGIAFDPPGVTAVQYLDLLGCLHKRTQLVHLCAATQEDVEVIALRGVTVAHCPRSNRNLACPAAPIAELRRRGVVVGLGLDSAASSGAIDMFAEMRAAMEVSGVTAEDAWEMATTDAAMSIGLERDWRIAEGADPDLVLLRSSAGSLEQLLRSGCDMLERL